MLPAPEPVFTPQRPDAPAVAEPIVEDRDLRIDEVVVDGMTVYKESEFAALLAPLVGPATKLSAVSEAIQAIQLRYNDDGYILSTVRGSIEPGDAKEQLVVRVVEGFISDVKLEGDIGPAGVLVFRYLDRLTSIRPVRIADLERYLLLAQDIPGVAVRSVLRPATGEAGAVQLIAQVARSEYSGYAGYDNRGPEFAGPHQLLVGGSSQSFTSLGEKIEGQFFNSFGREQIFGQINAQALIGDDGLRIRGYFGKGSSEPGGSLRETGYTGDLTVAGIGASYPWIRTRPVSVALTGDFDFYEAFVDTFGATGDLERQSNSKLRVLRGGVQVNSQDAWLAPSMTAANLLILRGHHGFVGLGSSSDESGLPPRVGNRIAFNKISGEVSRIQNLARIEDVTAALQVTIGGQWTRDILPPSEKFYLGGSRFGRGFYSGQITGDKALGVSLELQFNTEVATPLPLPGEVERVGLQFYGFYDDGQTFDLAPDDVDRHLESAGVGLRINLTEYVTAEIEGLRRFTRRPTSDEGSRERTYAVFGRLFGRF